MSAGAIPWPQPIRELRYALAESDTETPPPDLRSAVIRAALANRPAGMAAPAPAAITTIESYRLTVTSLDSLLAQLTATDWGRPALRDLDVHGLIGHLIGVEHDFQAQLDGAPAPSSAAEHIASTQAAAQAQAGRLPSHTHQDWLAATARTLEQVEAADEAVLLAPITMHRVTLPLEQWLVIRAFEMWTHEEDIRRATARPLLAPEPARLSLMTRLAVALLPAGMARAERAHSGETVRLVLTGNGGGTWNVPLDSAAPAPADVRIVVEAVTFCRLVANRQDPTHVGAVITGDHALGADVLVGAAALAFD
jgi:uncharacterized protein (TIGR03083 family)